MHEKLLKLGRRLLAESDIDALLQQAMDGAIDVTGAERGLILLFHPDGEIRFQTARHLTKADLENPQFEISRTIIDKVKTTGKMFCSHNVLKDPALNESKSAVRLNILSVICLPLCFEGNIFGVVYLDNRTILGAFKPELCRFAKDFADFISLAAYHALERKRLRNQVQALEQQLRERYDFKSIISHHPKMIRILKIVTQIADSEATVLIQGESGTGKELIARALHYNSFRRAKPFVTINCGAFQENLLESELFGHVRGAFTGAINEKIGWFERANHGTIFLDEVAEMTPALQVKLLRVLQTGEYSPVGSSKICHSNARVVAATNKDLQSLVKAGNFREDLFYRLNVIDIQLPPLRERKSDIPLLIQHFMQKYGHYRDEDDFRLAGEAEKLLFAYDYPGNIRELENIVARAVALTEGDTIELDDLPTNVCLRRSETTRSSKPSTLTQAKRQAADKAEQKFVIECLQTTRGHISNAAKMAGIDVSNFHKIMNKHGIDPNDFKRQR